MAWPQRSDFRLMSFTAPNWYISAWWYTNVNIVGSTPFANANICATAGPAIITRLQYLLNGALAPGWLAETPGAPLEPRPVVNGTLTFKTMLALHAYAKLLGDTPSNDIAPEIEDLLQTGGTPAQPITPAIMRYILWVSYYRKGFSSINGRDRIAFPALLGDLDIEKIFFSVLDLSDEEVRCIKRLIQNDGDPCLSLFEMVGSSDAKFPIFQRDAESTPPGFAEGVQGATSATDAWYKMKPACVSYKAARDSITSQKPNNMPQALRDEETYMVWRNWVLAGGRTSGRPSPAVTGVNATGTGASSSSRGGGGGIGWLLLALVGGYLATKD